MIFRQLFEPLSSTYTYLLGCEETGQAVLIDPVIAAMDRDLEQVHSLGLTLAFSLDTHIHADHITAALELKHKVGSQIAAPAFDRLGCADVGIEEGVPFKVGNLILEPLHTPGHTDGHFSYLLGDRLFTGDALLIEGCGRTDFQNGDADAIGLARAMLYDPRWPWHAAAKLGAKIAIAPQYLRCQPHEVKSLFQPFATQIAD